MHFSIHRFVSAMVLASAVSTLGSCVPNPADNHAWSSVDGYPPLDAEFGPAPGTKAYCFYHTSPVDLVKCLRKARSGCIIMMGFVPLDWVKPEHLPELMKLVRSEEPCARIIPDTSEKNGNTSSTVSREVLYIIDGYRQANFPSGLDSSDVKLTPDQAEEWWKRSGGVPEKRRAPLNPEWEKEDKENLRQIEERIRQEGIPVL